MGWALRRHDEDIEYDASDDVVDFLEHQRHGWFEIVIPSSLSNSKGYVDGIENTRYRAITVQGAHSLTFISMGMALLLTSYVF